MYITARSKWYLCFAALWRYCCIPPNPSEPDGIKTEFQYLQEYTETYFHTTPWEKVYSDLRGFALTRRAEQDAGRIFAAYTDGNLESLTDVYPDLQQTLKHWRWLVQHSNKSPLHDNF